MPQPDALRAPLNAQGVKGEQVSQDAVIAWDMITDAVGLAAAGASLEIYEMTY